MGPPIIVQVDHDYRSDYRTAPQPEAGLGSKRRMGMVFCLSQAGNHCTFADRVTDRGRLGAPGTSLGGRGSVLRE